LAFYFHKEKYIDLWTGERWKLDVGGHIKNDNKYKGRRTMGWSSRLGISTTEVDEGYKEDRGPFL